MSSRMRPAPQYRAFLIGTLSAVAVAGAIALSTPIPYLAAAGILLFCWPITGFLIDLIQRRNPQCARLEPAKRTWRRFAVWIAVLAIAAGLIRYYTHESFWLVFWGGLLGLCGVGSLNGLVMEAEDNAKGGWLNP